MPYMNGGGSIIGVIAKGLQDLDLKGFIDFPVPKWLEYLIKVIDFLNGHASDRAAARFMNEAVQKIDPDAVKVKNSDGSYSYADVPPEFRNPNMIVPPSSINNILNNKKINTDSRQINQNITIHTDQPANETYNQFTQARFAFGISSGW